MNILFVTVFQVSEQKGGTERTTARVSNELRHRGHKCYNLYAKPIGEGFEMTTFDGIYNDCSPQKVQEIININHIDKIILEGTFTLIKNVYKGRLNAFYHPEILFVHHFAPGFEPYFNAFRTLWYQFRHANIIGHKFKSLIKIVSYPVYKPYMDYSFHNLYKVAYTLCDKIVLLSSDYKKAYCQFGQIEDWDNSKFVSIPNAVSFDEFLDVSYISVKRKNVLIVSRLDEVQKRISLALRIWKKIECDFSLKEWTLQIVGYGESEHYYRQLIKSLNLKRVTFEGQQNPINYYKDSSLFMMTSLFEGWPMTLNEATQFGCVPIVYDTCASFHEIINHNENGFLISDSDEDEFYQKMKDVMLSDEKRQMMMVKAITLSRRFSLDNIVNQWEKLLNKTEE